MKNMVLSILQKGHLLVMRELKQEDRVSPYSLSAENACTLGNVSFLLFCVCPQMTAKVPLILIWCYEYILVNRQIL